MSKKKTLTLPPYKKKASCVEFCILRSLMSCVYGVVAFFVLIVYGVIIGFTSFINCFTVICTQSIWKPHYNFVSKLALWQAHMSMYLAAATDDNPPICP